jgi:amino acid adenylation domain-containing protein
MLLTTYLEKSYRRVPDKVAITDGETEWTFARLRGFAAAGARSLSGFGNAPVAVVMDKSPLAIAVFLAVLYSGRAYVPLSKDLGAARINAVLSNVEPTVVVTDDAEFSRGLTYDCAVLEASQIGSADAELPDSADAEPLDLPDTSTAFILHTSGSTGVPKCVPLSHRNAVTCVESLSRILDASEDSRFGVQVPLTGVAAVKDVYLSLKLGATLVLLPKTLFVTPVKLVEFLNAQRVDTLMWVASALSLVSRLGTFGTVKPEHLRNVTFTGEPMNPEQLRVWKSALPHVKFYNHYGHTEVCACSAYFAVGDSVPDVIPVGRHVPNTGLMIIADDGTEVTAPGVEGELYISGSRVAAGYYNDPERTAQSFVRNPLHSRFPDIVYKTGDLAKYNLDGDIVLTSRRDHLINLMGYRIELGELELQACKSDGVQAACAVHDSARTRIVLFYVGAAEESALRAHLKLALPSYMLPQRVVRLQTLPMTVTGKTDRMKLADMAKEY